MKIIACNTKVEQETQCLTNHIALLRIQKTTEPLKLNFGHTTAKTSEFATCIRATKT